MKIRRFTAFQYQRKNDINNIIIFNYSLNYLIRYEIIKIL